VTPSRQPADPAPHTPVLYQQVLTALQPGAGDRMIDGTVGAGGHAAGWLQASAPDGELLGLDRDPQALLFAGRRLAEFGGRVRLRQGSFADLREHAQAVGWSEVGAVLLDLGISSMQLAEPERGFSFQQEGPLDMRLDPGGELTAADVVNQWSERDLADIIWRYGEEPAARRVAAAILRARPILGTQQLAQVVARAVGGRPRRVHAATRTFQALRIAVNDELEALQSALPQALELLQTGGRLAVIAFHSPKTASKRFLREQAAAAPSATAADLHLRRRPAAGAQRKPLRPDDAEAVPTRARSADCVACARSGMNLADDHTHVRNGKLRHRPRHASCRRRGG
jgi:16S rRNA (cytosine1402-N4)-methyltransferase